MREQFRSLSFLGFPNYSINIFGEIKNIKTHRNVQHRIRTIYNNKPQAVLEDTNFHKRCWFLVEDLVSLTFYDLIDPIGSYKNRILEVKEFMLLTPNDKRKVYDKFGNQTKYIVTRFGDVWDPEKKKKLKKYVNNRGYFKVSINGYNFLIHQLVAQAFIPNPLKKPHINHKDRVRTNSFKQNLEWCTPKENLNHAINNQKWHDMLTDNQVNRIGILLQKGKSNEDISKITNVSIDKINGIRHRIIPRYECLPFLW